MLISPDDTRAVGRHLLYQGDCAKVLDFIDAESVDVIVTSPPYNLGIAYAGFDDRAGEEAYLEWIGGRLRRLSRVIKPRGSLFLNIGGSNTKPWLPFELPVFLRAMRDEHDRPLWRLQNHIVWAKSISVGERTHGQLKPINSERFLNHTHEVILHLTRAGVTPLDRLAIGVPYADKTNIARFGEKGRPDLKCRGDVWFIPYETVQSKEGKFNHPASFPIALPEMCIRLHGVSDAVVLDPFSGVGTTVAAAHLTGCRGIGIELGAAYHQAAVERLRRLVGGD